MRAKSEISWILIVWALSNSLQAQLSSFSSLPPYAPQPKSVTELSGIDIYSTSVAQLIQQFGNPIRISSAPGVHEALWTQYEWEGVSWSMRITSENKVTIMSIDVWGRPDGKVGRTKEGLMLGASVYDAQRIYGSRFCSELYVMGGWFRCPGGKRHQFDNPQILPPRGYVEGRSTVLELDYDHRVITHMKLRRLLPDW